MNATTSSHNRSLAPAQAKENSTLIWLERDDQTGRKVESMKPRPSDPLRMPTEALDGLSIDFNPRDLILKWRSSQTADPDSPLDAIFIPTKGRVQHVQELLNTLDGQDVPVFLLPSSPEDIPFENTWHGRPVQSLFFRDHSASQSVLHDLRSATNPLFATPASAWDLPLKRNFALWHAREKGFSSILLVDDDIRGINAALFRDGAAALQQLTVAGVFIDDFPDTSVVGHVELALGEEVIPFLSGSCLFVRCGSDVGFFPQIYNEDWIFMAPHMERRSICSLGSICQETYDPLSDPSRPAFQEPGEIIADGLFALLACGYYADRFHQNTWRAILSKRREWLTVLTERSRNPPHLAAVAAARALCDRVTAHDCASYVADLECDRQTWNSRLKELK